MESNERQLEIEIAACKQLGWDCHAMTLDGDHVLNNVPGVPDSDREQFEALVKAALKNG